MVEKQIQANVKYIFLDIVKYTQGRSVEAQQDIIESLNNIVRESIDELTKDECKIIYLPTGDGLCISLINYQGDYDIDLQIALKIVEKVHNHNESIKDKMRVYEVRIGLNSNVDNIVTDINGKENVAGAGINAAQRIMNVADGNQIIVSQSVFETLQYRERYMHSFNRYQTMVKHNIPLSIYQYLDKDSFGLNCNIPQRFDIKIEDEKPEEILNEIVAYYMAHATENYNLLKRLRTDDGFRSDILVIYLYLKSRDSFEIRHKDEFENPILFINEDKHPEDMIKILYNSYTWTNYCLAEFIENNFLKPYDTYFKDSLSGHLIVNESGILQVREDWPHIWDEFNLVQYL